MGWDPVAQLGGLVAQATTDAWTAMMLGLWDAGLWMLRLALSLMDGLLTPDLSTGGPAAAVYRTTFWLSAALAVLLAVAQLGLAAFRRDGQTLARLAVGVAQYGLVWVGWLGYAVLLLGACSGLTRALAAGLLDVTDWSSWQPLGGLELVDDVERGVATVLGLMGLLLWVGAVAHLLVMLTRAGALVVLAATAPVAAAGLVGDTGRAWFWKAFRWFHAAALTPVLMVLMLGVGVRLATDVAQGAADSAQAALAAAVPAVLLILMATFSPLVLFKLLAFTDPGTSSGAGMRAGLAAQGGVQGLLARGSGAGGSTAATTSAGGASAGEAAAGAATAGRFAAAGSALGPVGTAAAAALAVVHATGTRGAAIAADLTNQMGVGHGTYIPDFSATNPRLAQRDRDVPQVHGTDPTAPGPGGPGGTGGPGAGAGDADRAATGPPPRAAGTPGAAGGGEGDRR